MKTMKKIMALVLVVVLALALSVTVFAANDGSIEMNNATVGETYKIYKVFDLTYSGTGETSTGTVEGGDPAYRGVSYTYTKTGDSDALYAALAGVDSPFTLTLTSTANVYAVALQSGKSAADISTFLKANVNKLTPVTGATTTNLDTNDKATATDIKWSGLGYGYYYVTSSLGSTVTIDSTLKDVIVKDKNSTPSQDKTQWAGPTAPTSATGYTNDPQQVQVGDHVWYQIEVKDGKGSEKAITITDTMTNGLSFDNNIKVFKSAYNSETKTYGDESEVTASATTWTQTAPTSDDTFTFKVTFVDSYVVSLNENDKVFIRFSATVTQAAVTDTDADKETNTSRLDYSNQHSEDSVDVVTYKVQLDKVKNKDANYDDLLGAQFELYRGTGSDDVVAANKIWFVKGTAEGSVPVLTVVGKGADAPVSSAFSVIALTDDTSVANHLDSSKVIIKGLDKDTYVLHETEAPAGYNIAADQTIADTVLVAIDGTITDTVGKIGTDDTAVVSVINETGTELPSTGGMGTKVIYGVGAVLVLGAAVTLVSRKRAGE